MNTQTEKPIKERLFDLLYESLNEKQREAVYQVKGPLLVLAGAGSGKTTVLTRRIAHLIRFGDAVHASEAPLSDAERAALEEVLKARPVDRDLLIEILKGFAVEPCEPWQVLAITFTNKAAGEIRARLEAELKEAANEIWAGTFHSICVRILRRYITLLGYQSDFSIFDADDSKKLITSILKDLNVDEKALSPREVQNEISRAKNAMRTPEGFAARGSVDFFSKTVSEVYTVYNQRLFESNALDFDDILCKTVSLLENFSEPRDYCQNRFRYVLVDEYQDTNPVQFRLVQLIAAKHRNVMVVGDDDQSIYKFRGATIENILTFDQSYPDAKCVYLEQNYRSTGNILAAANAVISHNRERKGKKLWCDAENGDKLQYFRLGDQEEEASFLVDRIAALVRDGKCEYRDCAVLYRVGAQANALESVFAKSGLPHRQLSGLRFYDRAEIKDILAYLCVVQNPADDLHLLRIVNLPRRGIGDTTIAAARAIAQTESKTLFSVLNSADQYPELSRASARIKEFCNLIAIFIEARDRVSLSELFSKVMDESGYTAMLEAGGKETAEKLDNIRELVSSAIAYEEQHEDATLAGFLEEAALISDIDNYDESANAVILMTIHSAKGLEFDYVFLPGFEESIFPSSRSWDSDAQLEEERRLAYVALTRARKGVTITTAATRLIYGHTTSNPVSRFAKEIPPELLEGDPIKKLQREGLFQKADAHFSGEIRTARAIAEKTLAPRRPGIRQTTVAGQAQKAKEVFGAGARVVHPMFGAGTVLRATPMAQDMLYEIAFDEVGTKKIMGNYAKLTKE